MVELPAHVVRSDDWFVLLDPAWSGIPETAGTPPPEAVVGGWEVGANGTVGPFRPNPRYCPSGPDVPTDPVDAVLRRAAVGERLGTEFLRLLRDSVVEIGCDEPGRPLVGAAPDGSRCVVVATAERQKDDVDVEQWLPVPGHLLAQAVPSGVDVLINPAGCAPLRVPVENLVTAVPEGPAEV